MKKFLTCLALAISVMMAHAQVAPRVPASSQITGVSGVGHVLATANGSPTGGHCTEWDPAGTGDIIDAGAACGSGSTSIANNTVLGNVSGSTGAAAALNASQLATILSATALSATGGVTATADGTHAGIFSLVGNTANPTIPTNSVGFLGPNLASFTSYFLQFSTTAPSGNFLQCAAPSGNVSVCTWASASGLPSGLTFSLPTLTISSATNGNGAVALSGNTSGASTMTAPAVAGTQANPISFSNNLLIPAGGYYNIGSTSGVQMGDPSGSGTEGALDVGGTDVFTFKSTGPIIRPATPLGFFTSGFSVDAAVCHDSAASLLDISTSQTSCNSSASVKLAQIQHGILYSAAGTALPSCVTGLKGTETVVSDATSPTFLGTYASGGAVASPVMCNGTNWVTY